MTDQLQPSTTGEAAADPAITGASPGDRELAPHQSGAFTPYPAFHGRAVSWIAVTLIVIAFVAGGLALVFGPTWWLFWASLALAAVGGLLAIATNIFEDWY
jgi:hypothetical protein